MKRRVGVIQTMKEIRRKTIGFIRWSFCFAHVFPHFRHSFCSSAALRLKRKEIENLTAESHY